MIDTDIESIEHLDFDEELPCESSNMGGTSNCIPGPQPAEWRLLVKDHGHGQRVALVCTNCLTRKLNREKVRCKICQMVFTPPSTAYESITRIKE